MLKINDIICRDSSRLFVRALGIRFPLPENDSLIPALFHNGSYGIVDEQTLELVEPNEIAARKALHDSIEMPVLMEGRNPNVLYINGADVRGRFTIKLFQTHARIDELHRFL